MRNEGDVIKYVATAKCEKHDQLHWLATFPVNKAWALKPTYTAFEFSLHHAT